MSPFLLNINVLRIDQISGIWSKWSEVKWVTVKILGTKVPCTLGLPCTEGTWFYCDYFIWCVSCTVVVLTCFIMYSCFGNMCTYIYCVLYRLYCVLIFRLCIFILFFFVYTSVRTTATEWNLNYSKQVSNNNNNNNKYFWNGVNTFVPKSMRILSPPHDFTINDNGSPQINGQYQQSQWATSANVGE
jgi:hypothetical protein